MLIGREPELALINEAVEQAIAGRGSWLMMAGEPGIGKSRLAEE
ncbi:MAG: ATP-binding protein, partial [Burkholderiales bacterium]